MLLIYTWNFTFKTWEAFLLKDFFSESREGGGGGGQGVWTGHGNFQVAKYFLGKTGTHYRLTPPPEEAIGLWAKLLLEGGSYGPL